MDTNRTKTIERDRNINNSTNDVSEDELTEARLNSLLSANAEYARKNEVFLSDKEESETSMIKNPLSNEKAFALFGLFLGAFPPAAFFLRIFFVDGNISISDSWVFLLFLLVNVVTATVGYFSGKLVGKIAGELEKVGWHWMLLALPFVGMLWGLVSGGVGGVFLFVIGAVFGGLFGGAVGTFALPLFTMFHRMFKKGDAIDRNIFLPIALGISMAIAALIFGFPSA